MPAATPATLAQRALDLVPTDPRRARATAESVLATPSADPKEQVIARRALGMAVRELHDFTGAAGHLRRAVTLAERRGLELLGAEARMSLALVLDDLGRPAEALRAIDEALAVLTGLPRARARMQQALILHRMGRDDEALAGYRAVLAVFRRYGDGVWQARTLVNRGIVHAYQGNFTLAQADMHSAAEFFAAGGHAAALAQVQHNLGFVFAQAGDVPAALEWYGRSDDYFRRNGSPGVILADRAEVLLSASLLPEAAEIAAAAAEASAKTRVPGPLAQARLLQARIALATGDPSAATRTARSARRAFLRQDRTNWAELARYAEALARPTHRKVRSAAAALEATGWTVPQWDAWLDAAELAIKAGDLEAARIDLERAQGARKRGAGRQRARAWHVEALLRLAHGDRPGAKRAAATGLREVDAYRASLGATELRIRGGASVAAELATLRLRMALQEGRPAEALTWAERARANALRMPPTKPAAAEVAAPLAELRRVAAELSAVPTDQRRAARLLRRQRVLEEQIRRATWRTRGSGLVEPTVPLADLATALDDRALVEILNVDGDLHALLVIDGRVRHRALGPLAAIADEVHALRFALRRLVLGQGNRRSAQGALAHAVHRLNETLLVPLSDAIGERGLVLAPTGVLHALPWPLLPSCAGRALTVTPAATLWHRAATAPSVDGPTVLVAGPQPPQAPAEVATLAALMPGVIVLSGSRSRTRSVLEALNGARIGHVATHGEFRADNPLFSHLLMADGPLTVHDLSTMEQAPELLVLSACDTGLSAVHPGDELMGLSAALLGLGTRTIIATIGPVDDEVTGTFMIDVYRRLGAGAAPAVALAEAQAAATDEARTTTHSFVCLGA